MDWVLWPADVIESYQQHESFEQNIFQVWLEGIRASWLYMFLRRPRTLSCNDIEVHIWIRIEREWQTSVYNPSASTRFPRSKALLACCFRCSAWRLFSGLEAPHCRARRRAACAGVLQWLTIISDGKITKLGPLPHIPAIKQHINCEKISTEIIAIPFDTMCHNSLVKVTTNTTAWFHGHVGRCQAPDNV